MTYTPSIKEPYPGEFFRCIAGGELVGTSLGTGDRDELGLCIEGPEAVVGLNKFEQYTWRSQPEGVPSGPNDTDLTVYGLRKFLTLASTGNPNIMNLLFVPPELTLFANDPYAELCELAPFIVSRKAGAAFLGYLQAQKQRMLGERHGRARQQRDAGNYEYFDGKAAAHMVRLGYQGVELLTYGRLTLPLRAVEREYCLSVRRGEVSMDHVLQKTGEFEAEIEALRHESPVPENPDRDVINDFLYRAYTSSWETRSG